MKTYQVRADYNSIFLQQDFDDGELMRLVLAEFEEVMLQVEVNEKLDAVDHHHDDTVECNGNRNLAVKSGFDNEKLIDFY